MTLSSSTPPTNLAPAIWGIFGTILVLAEAIFRLSVIAFRTLADACLAPVEVVFFVVWMAFILYVEGYRAFHKRFSPRVVARGFHLAAHPRPLHVILAPLYCMALLHAKRRRLIANWILVAGIVTIIIFVRHLPPVYRAIIDAGVACALTLGAVSMILYFIRRLRGEELSISLDLP